MGKRIDRDAIHADLRSRFGATITRAQMEEYRRETGTFPGWFYTEPFGSQHKISRGTYRIPTGNGAVVSAPTARRATAPKSKPAPFVPQPRPIAVPANTGDEVPATTLDLTETFLKTLSADDRLQAIALHAELLSRIPAVDPKFVPFGEYETVRAIIASGKFRPAIITGLSGNGKTFQIKQACAATQREFIRVNITAETDEDDLLGGFRLVDGSTVFEPGPVVVAMLRGAVLLIDEYDLASPKIMCLQPILEGESVTLKKIGVVVTPTAGFQVFATANTKGRGSEDGRFAGANIQNEAFLDRFYFTIEQDYPSATVEKKILRKTFEAEGYEMTDHAATFFDTLTKWAASTRETFAQGGIEDLIATRRLTHIVKLYGDFGGDDQKALGLALNRFDDKVKDAFVDLYNKLAPDFTAPSNVPDLD